METMVKGSIKRSRARILDELGGIGGESSQKKLVISE